MGGMRGGLVRGGARRRLLSAATPTGPTSTAISREAAAGKEAPLWDFEQLDLRDRRDNSTKLRDMLVSDKLGFLMEAHVRAL